MKICKFCRAQNEDTVSSCTSCGANEFYNKCLNCGTLFSSRFCPNCGVRANAQPHKCPTCGEVFFSVACPRCGYSPLKFAAQSEMRASQSFYQSNDQAPVVQQRTVEPVYSQKALDSAKEEIKKDVMEQIRIPVEKPRKKRVIWKVLLWIFVKIPLILIGLIILLFILSNN